MKITRSIHCRDIKKLNVVDSSGKTVGHIGDMTFTYGPGLNLSRFILSGPMTEELLEALRIRPDRDPVFDASLIEKIDSRVHLSVPLKDLKTTLDKDSIGPSEIRLSKLEKMSMYDRNGAKIGHPIDIHFSADGSGSVIVGGGFIEETLETLGVVKDVDIVVPCNVIKSVGTSMKLTVTKDELGTTLESAIKEKEREISRVRESRAATRSVVEVQLFAQKPR